MFYLFPHPKSTEPNPEQLQPKIVRACYSRPKQKKPAAAYVKKMFANKVTDKVSKSNKLSAP